MKETKEELMRLLESLTPGGSEFHNNPELCVAWVRQRLSSVIAQITLRKLAEAEHDELLAVLKIYADKDNWTEEAVTYVLDGTVSATGNEGERRAVLLMDTPIVWNYSEEGYDVAQDAIAKAEGQR